ncbi:MAG: reverse transcriptase domain-containing protein [Luteolibacter sp.]
MKNEVNNRWEDIVWGEATSHAFKLKRRLHDAELRDDKNTVAKLQQQIVNSFHPKALAVRQVAQISKGRKTAGIDGVKSPTPAQMMRMATDLSIHHQPSPVRRLLIPKPGKTEKRPLGIPNLIDRAHQALIVMALEPQWEARFSPHQYGFRKGRGTHDAIGFIQRHLRQAGPKWVLEIDIESFFDRIDHEELLRRLNAPPAIENAVRRILNAGVLHLSEHLASTVGTPQGGPLSPTLANIALAGLEGHLMCEFRRVFAGRITALGYPTLVVYADDAVVMHADRSVVEWSRTAIQTYLAPLGLRLNESKTRVSHTQQPVNRKSGAGFDFLGFHIQHVWTKKSGGNRHPYILITPSNHSVKRFYRDCAERIDKLTLSRKRRGARRDLQAKGKIDPVTLMIRDLNRSIRGWTNYFCYSNAKEVFSGLDYLLHGKLWQWAIRRFDRKTREWIINHLFSGVETDRKGKPLLRRDGNPRERGWAFKSPFAATAQPHTTLLKLADIPILRQILVKPGKSFYDGDWPYWQPRMRQRYPGTPPMITIAPLRRQKGLCAVCRLPFQRGQMLSHVQSKGRYRDLVHTECSTSSPSAPEQANLPTEAPDMGCPV